MKHCRLTDIKIFRPSIAYIQVENEGPRVLRRLFVIVKSVSAMDEYLMVIFAFQQIRPLI